MIMWSALLAGILPVAGLIFWWWNDIWYAWWLSYRCSGDGTKLPPGYMGIPFLGEMLNFLWYFKVVSRPEDFINAKRRKYGGEVGMFRSHLFGSPTIIVWSPSITKLVLQTESAFDCGQNWPTLELLGMNSIAAKHGSEYTRMRGLIVRASNQPEALRRVALSIQPRILHVLQSWTQKGSVLAYDVTKKLIFENIAKCFASFEPGPHLDTLSNLFEGLMNGIRAYPLNIPGTTYYHALKCRKKAILIFETELKKRKETSDDSSVANDLMDDMIQLRDEEGTQLNENEVLDNILNIIIAGHESTALSLMWAFYHLNKNPLVLQKLREENMSISKKKGSMIEYDEITKLPYTRKVVEEIVRLANISPFIFREAHHDVEHKGYKIPKGWKVICWVRYLHTNPENFQAPLIFNPDRWDGESKLGASYWFGGGKRVCCGNMMARMIISIFLHHLVVGYRWELTNPDAEEIAYLPKPKPVDGVQISITNI